MDTYLAIILTLITILVLSFGINEVANDDNLAKNSNDLEKRIIILETKVGIYGTC